LSIFLLPWQLRHTVYFASYGGNYFEYPSIHLYATDLVMAVLVGWWLLRGGRNQVVSKLVWIPIALWLTWATLAGNLGVDVQNSLQQSAHYWLCFGWLMYLVNNVKTLAELVWPLVWGVIAQAGVGVAQFVLNHDLGWQTLGESPLQPNQGGVMVVGDALHRQIRAYGLMPHPNMLGGWLAFGILPMAWLWTKIKKFYWVILIAFGLTGVGLVMAFSRMGWVIAIVAVVVGLVLITTKRWSKTTWLPMMILIVGAIMTLWQQWSNVTGRFEFSSALEQKSVNERIVGLQSFGETMTGHWLAGVGVGNYALALIERNPDQLVWTYKPVHNIFLLVLAETGAVGLAIWGWMVGIGLWLWWKIIRRDWTWGWVGLPLFGILAGGMIDHWVVSFQQGRLLFFLALALIIFTSNGIVKAINR